jgi:hypothetical protein
VRFTVGHAQHHEAATTEISGVRVNHSQRKAGSYRRVDCVSARLQHL